MNGSGQVRRLCCRIAAPMSLLAVPILAVVLFSSVVATAGRSDAADSGGAQVAEGLKTIQNTAADVAKLAGHFTDQATKLADGIEPVWKPIEDKVRANDKDAYVALEDGFAKLGTAAKAGDAKKADEASQAIAAAVKAYSAKHPAVPATPAPAARAADAASPGSTGATPAPTRAAAAATPATAPTPAVGAPSIVSTPAAPDAALARTGPHTASGLAALAGAAFGLGGLALIAGARRRSSLAS